KAVEPLDIAAEEAREGGHVVDHGRDPDVRAADKECIGECPSAGEQGRGRGRELVKPPEGETREPLVGVCLGGSEPRVEAPHAPGSIRAAMASMLAIDVPSAITTHAGSTPHLRAIASRSGG